PLQAVSMSTELLIRKVGLDDAALSYIARIKGGTRHMGAMVKDLLEFVRSRLGASLPIQRKPMELASACREAIEEACAGQPECDPTFDVSGDTHGEWDRGRIDQLLQNLIGNALQHGSNNHKIRLTLSADETSVTLVMQNFGEPIAEDAMGTLFDPLVRSASEELGHPSTSLGLGLFIVKEVVSAHNGCITVTSNRDDGTTFTVVLPKS
ncbi:HAMP domain-containing sensor histidine kinase, partial [Pseudomonas sp. CCC3.2]